jgi:hypothetical protein
MSNIKIMSKEEAETIINFDESSDIAIVYTCSKKIMQRLDKLCLETSVYSEKYRDEVSKTYVCPKNLIWFRKPRLIPRESQVRMASTAYTNFENLKNKKGV